MKQLLFLAFLGVSLVSCASCSKNAVTPTSNNNTNPTGSKIKIKIGNSTFTATLYDNQAAKAFKSFLPLTLNMIELNGNEKFTLSNGAEIPKLGLGTWFINDKDVAQAVKEAVRIGYRHIDTAQAYGNESGVGEGIKICGVKREEMFVTTKLAAEVKSYKEAVASIDGSLKKLGLNYIDLMIIHSPKPWAKFLAEEPYFEGNREAWRALEEAYKAGKLSSIGVSNFEKTDIDNILSSHS